ncbi:MAG: hypothetical protein WBA74_05660 [Cyclobacteriaceae bacterium]
MKILKNLLLIVLCCFLISCISKGQATNTQYEERALSFVYDSLIIDKQLLKFNNGFSGKYSVDLKGLLDEGFTFYNSGNTCFLSRIDKVEDRDSPPDILKLIEGLNEDHKLKDQLNQKHTRYNIPQGIKKVDYNDFTNEKDEKSFYLTVRHHISFGDLYLVEISASSKMDISNSSQFIFYIYLNNKLEIINWNFLEGYDPITESLCE